MLQDEFAELLPEKACHYLDRIVKASSMMGELIDDLLQLSRVGRAEMSQVPVNLSDLARHVVEMLQGTRPDRSVEYVIADDMVAMGDRTLLRLTLENLLGNAWKYTERQPSARIEFGTAVVDHEETFFVRDNGVGFDMTYADKLFHPFQRLHGQEFEGTGIGLATVRRIIERHNGRVWGEGKEGEGATFYFTLGERRVPA
jgi:light-regulated signal transduction histidine kinase (bacteriophytochrome)